MEIKGPWFGIAAIVLGLLLMMESAALLAYRGAGLNLVILMMIGCTLAFFGITSLIVCIVRTFEAIVSDRLSELHQQPDINQPH